MATTCRKRIGEENYQKSSFQFTFHTYVGNNIAIPM